MVFSSLPERCLELDDLPRGNPFGIIGTGECGQLSHHAGKLIECVFVIVFQFPHVENLGEADRLIRWDCFCLPDPLAAVLRRWVFGETRTPHGVGGW